MTGERPKIGQPRFLTLVEILDAHETAIARHGGAKGVRDPGALESALAMPEQAFGGELAHPFPFMMASAYAFHIAKNHPFVDGNKRTAFIASALFLWMNGWRLQAGEADAERAVLDLVTSKLSKAEFAGWLQDHSVARPSLELRDFFSRISGDAFVEFFQPTRPDATGQDHFQREMEEAVSAMPVIHHLLDINRVATARNDESTRITSTSAILTLMTLQRLAENMGYEW